MSTIGERIKRIRKIHEYNQVEFSNMIGVSKSPFLRLFVLTIQALVPTKDKSLYLKLDSHWGGSGDSWRDFMLNLQPL